MSGLRSIFSNTLAAVSDAAAAAAAATAPSHHSTPLSLDPTPAGNAQPQTNLERYIDRACSSLLIEPDIALNMEICDLINKKGGNSAHLAAVRIVRLANSKQSNVTRLALELLDVCAKNCGFPFHLQLANREFLNALVKRFPLTPPALISSAHVKTLELIEQWNATIAQEEKTLKHMINIRKMHSLLEEKGYNFPSVPNQGLIMLQKQLPEVRSAEDLEAEDVGLMRACLQDLLRIQEPDYLEKANCLMKQIVGHDDGSDLSLRQKYRMMELGDVQQAKTKALEAERLLKESYSNTKPDYLTVLLRSCRVARDNCIQILDKRETNLEHIVDLIDTLNRVLDLYDSMSGTMERAPESANQHQQQQLSCDKGSSAPPLESQVMGNQCVDLLNFEPENIHATTSNKAQPVENATNLLALNDNVHKPSSTAGTPSSQQACTRSDTVTVYMSRELLIEVEVSHYAAGTEVLCMFSNISDDELRDLVWQIATPKSLALNLGPLSATKLAPRSIHGATQSFYVSPAPGSGAEVLAGKNLFARFRIQFSRANRYAIDNEGAITLSPTKENKTLTPTPTTTTTTTTAPAVETAVNPGLYRVTTYNGQQAGNFGKEDAGKSLNQDLMI